MRKWSFPRGILAVNSRAMETKKRKGQTAFARTDTARDRGTKSTKSGHALYATFMISDRGQTSSQSIGHA